MYFARKDAVLGNGQGEGPCHVFRQYRQKENWHAGHWRNRSSSGSESRAQAVGGGVSGCFGLSASDVRRKTLATFLVLGVVCVDGGGTGA